MANNADHEEAQNIAVRAIEIAKSHKHEMATLEHVLSALLELPDIQTCLTSLSIDFKPIIDAMDLFFSGGFIATTARTENPMKSASFDELFMRAVGTAIFSSRKKISSVDILLHLCQFPHEDSYAVVALLQAGVNSLLIKKYLAHGQPSVSARNMGQAAAGLLGPDGMSPQEVEPSTREEAIAYLAKFATNLNEEAKQGKIDPVIGRIDELEQTTQIIARRRKNNCIYVGDAGVGKTSLVEGLAYNITQGKVPSVLKNAVVWSLDIGSVVAGTKFRGEFEERMKMILKSLLFLGESTDTPEMPILFIDEIHTMMEAGSGGRGSLDISNMLKPALAKGTLRCIGSTTQDEYRKYFLKDKALVRRFTKVQINEPSPELTKLILRGLRKVYEAYHKVTFTDAALDAAVDLTHKHVRNSLLPDKAIDMMDQAGATQRVKPEKKRLAIIDVAQIEAEVSKIVKIPAKEITENDADKLGRLEGDLQAAIYGQPKAIEALTDSVIVSRAGLREQNLPAGSYLFSGPTGVGKTELARQLAKTLNIPLIKFDMSEYMEKHSISKLIGSPPGYVGYGDGAAGEGLLINAIETNPSCVLLLDEIEKAHGDMFNLLLQVMDDAKLTSSQGKTVWFNNVILIMTTNAGVPKATTSIGFGSVDDAVGDLNHEAIKELFKPEFRNRLDAIVPFTALQPETMLKIVDKFLVSLSLLALNRGVILKVSNEAKSWLANKGYDPLNGARPLTRVIDQHIKKTLGKEMLFGELKNGGTAKIDVKNGAIVIGYSPIRKKAVKTLIAV